MHSRIFELKIRYDKKDNVGGDTDSLYEESNLADMINADYAYKQELSEFQEDLSWLRNVYKIDIPTKTIQTHDNTITVGVIDKDNINKWIDVLKRQRIDRIEQARKMLEQPIDKVNCWLVADIIYPKDSFWFKDPDNGLYSEADVINVLNQKDIKRIYITSSYDYHF